MKYLSRNGPLLMTHSIVIVSPAGAWRGDPIADTGVGPFEIATSLAHPLLAKTAIKGDLTNNPPKCDQVPALIEFDAR